MARHVVLGTGAVGMAVVDELLERGEQIRVVNRRGRALVAVGIDVRAGNVLDRAFLEEVLLDADVVYFCVNPPYHQWVGQFEDMQDAVLDAAAASETKVVAMENLYMYGEMQSSAFTEDDPQTPHTTKGKLRAAMARSLQDAHASGRVRTTSGRASDFFGPRVGASAMDHRVFRPIIAGKSGRALGKVTEPHTYTYIPDIGHTGYRAYRISGGRSSPSDLTDEPMVRPGIFRARRPSLPRNFVDGSGMPPVRRARSVALRKRSSGWLAFSTRTLES